MGCDIHLKLEWRYKEPTNKVIRRAEYDESGNKVEDEVRFPEHDEWRCSKITGWGQEWSCRTYPMFAKLADVRNYGDVEHLPVRGFPNDAAYDTKKMYADYQITETQEEADKIAEKAMDWGGYGYAVSKEEAERYVKNGVCEYVDIDGKIQLSCPDWHSASWCSTKELEDCINKVFFNHEEGKMIGWCEDWLALLGAMKGYEMNDKIECRVVFWFDN